MHVKVNIYVNIYVDFSSFVNPIPTSQGQNQPLYERHMTKSSQNRVKSFWYLLPKFSSISHSTNLGNQYGKWQRQLKGHF